MRTSHKVYYILENFHTWKHDPLLFDEREYIIKVCHDHQI